MRVDREAMIGAIRNHERYFPHFNLVFTMILLKKNESKKSNISAILIIDAAVTTGMPKQFVIKTIG